MPDNTQKLTLGAQEALTPENTTIVMIDYAIGFANIVRSQELTHFLNNVLMLARTALDYESGFVVTNGPPEKSSGPYYPKLLEVLGDHPIIVRGGMFNAFPFPGFAEAVAAAKRPNIVVGGVATDGCVLQTVLGAVRAGYNADVVVDACGAQSREMHEVSIQRLICAGVTPVTAFALAGEFQVDQSLPGADRFFNITRDFNVGLTFQSETFQYAQEIVKKDKAE